MYHIAYFHIISGLALLLSGKVGRVLITCRGSGVGWRLSVALWLTKLPILCMDMPPLFLKFAALCLWTALQNYKAILFFGIFVPSSLA